MTRTISKIAYHRNGISGVGFHVVTFKDPDAAPGLFVATVFPDDELPGGVAVLNVPMLSDDNIEFAQGNSWRGDEYAAWLREEIKKWSDNRYS